MTSIVLTGTIVPQSNFVGVTDVETRRQEYLRCLDYYRQFADVFFLENSAHDTSADRDFQLAGVTVVKFSENDTEAFRLGKGFQEFKMMDNFVKSADCPLSFYKITGRRLVKNFSALSSTIRADDAVFDIVAKNRIVDTSFFHCSKDFYIENVGSSRVDLQACKLEYSIVSPK